MKIKRLFWLFATALFVATSCENIDAVKNISLSCRTEGLKDGSTTLPASWSANEQIYLFRSEDWSAALLTQSSGIGEATATFTGSSAGTKSGYYAIRPASAAGSVMPNGTVAVTVPPANIAITGENISGVIPQIGVGNADGLKFTSIFGALKFRLSGDYEVSNITLADPDKNCGLYGTFGYNFTSGAINDDVVFYEVSRIFGTPLALTYNPTIYISLPAVHYDRLELMLKDSQTGNSHLYTIENVDVVRNTATEISLGRPTVVSCVVGSWHMVRFCGAAAEVDLYINFTREGNFTICQRSGNLAYAEFNGTYTIDEAASTISGVYDDGEPWGDSYKFSLDADFNLVLESVANSAEVSVYEPAEMPAPATQSVSRAAAGSVKPF